MDAGAEIGHQVTEGAGFPPFVEGFERLRYAVRGRSDLVGIDGVALPAVFRAWESGVPSGQRLATDEVFLHGCYIRRTFLLSLPFCPAWPQGCATNYVHSGRS